MSKFKPYGYPGTMALRYNVAPRYTPGSPALVREDVARRVMRDEQAEYEQVIAGLYGEDKKEQASRLGLSGIVEERWEFRGVVMYRDLLTGETGSVKDREQRGLYQREVATVK